MRELPAGTCVSYGRTAVLKRDSKLAVVPIGYGDGYPRRLSNQMVMEIHGARCPIVGRVCMDMCMVDVTDLPDLQNAPAGEEKGLWQRESANRKKAFRPLRYA